jgi:hypothetical protein
MSRHIAFFDLAHAGAPYEYVVSAREEDSLQKGGGTSTRFESLSLPPTGSVGETANTQQMIWLPPAPPRLTWLCLQSRTIRLSCGQPIVRSRLLLGFDCYGIDPALRFRQPMTPPRSSGLMRHSGKTAIVCLIHKKGKQHEENRPDLALPTHPITEDTFLPAKPSL